MSRIQAIHGPATAQVALSATLTRSPHFRRETGFKSVASASFRHGGAVGNSNVRVRALVPACVERPDSSGSGGGTPSTCCVCGKPIEITPRMKRRGGRHTCSPGCRGTIALRIVHTRRVCPPGSQEEKLWARNLASQAYRRGDIVRPDKCSACGRDLPLEMHHDDYAEPLRVRWLCESCHQKTHLTPSRNPKPRLSTKPEFVEDQPDGDCDLEAMEGNPAYAAGGRLHWFYQYRMSRAGKAGAA